MNVAESRADVRSRPAELLARRGVTHHPDPAVIGAEAADARVDLVGAQERVGDAIAGRQRQLLGQERSDVGAAQRVAAQDRDQPAGEEHLARRAQLGVAQAPLALVLAGACRRSRRRSCASSA